MPAGRSRIWGLAFCFFGLQGGAGRVPVLSFVWGQWGAGLGSDTQPAQLRREASFHA